MTKPQFDFSDENRGMARRALWLLRGNSPQRKIPDDMLPYDVAAFAGSDGFLLPLAQFALRRWWDAERDSPPELPSGPVRLHADACVAERKADELVRAALSSLESAAARWSAAMMARSDADEQLKGVVASDERGAPIGYNWRRPSLRSEDPPPRCESTTTTTGIRT